MLLHVQVWALMLLQESGSPQWDFRHLWGNMGTLAKCVVIVMFLMSAWSIGVMIDRLMAFNAARKQSRAFAPAVAGALREGKLDEAIKIADRYKKKWDTRPAWIDVHPKIQAGLMDDGKLPIAHVFDALRPLGTSAVPVVSLDGTPAITAASNGRPTSPHGSCQRKTIRSAR